MSKDSSGDLVSSLIDNTVGWARDSIMSNSANAKSKRAVMMQYSLQNNLMDKQNEYNKPINQMARLREAGLNPNLVYGNNTATMASASGGTPSAPDVTPASGTFDIIGKMQALQAMKQSEANIGETEARTDAIDENIKLKKQELELRQDALNVQKMLAKQGYALNAEKMAKIQAEIEYLKNKFNIKNPNDWKKALDSIQAIIDGGSDNQVTQLW